MYILHNRRVSTKSAACQLFWSPIETDGAWREVGELDLIQNISFLLTWEVKQSGVRARVAKGACSSDHASTTLKIHQNLFAKVKRKKLLSCMLLSKSNPCLGKLPEVYCDHASVGACIWAHSRQAAFHSQSPSFAEMCVPPPKALLSFREKHFSEYSRWTLCE